MRGITAYLVAAYMEKSAVIAFLLVILISLCLILPSATPLTGMGRATFSLGTLENRIEVSLSQDALPSEGTPVDHEDERVKDFFRALGNVKRDEEGEVVDWYDDSGKVITQLPRRFVHDHNLLHRGIGALILSSSGEAFMHMRSKRKRTWPGLKDSLIGGINTEGQSGAQTLARELNEEVGLDITQEPAPIVSLLGQCRIATSQNQCIVDAYCVRLVDNRELRFADGEVEWGKWVPVKELQGMINEDESAFVPSGLQVWRFIESLTKSNC